MPFNNYAKYYDLFYADKNYAGEVAFVVDVIRRHSSGARSFLDLGCGSGRHAVELVKAGFSVTGLDTSAEMIASGKERAASLPIELRDRLTLIRGDAVNHHPGQTYEAVVALFHVINYQTTNDALRGVFSSARKALAVDGVFVFDFWYGPAVLTEKPEIRIRRIETAETKLTRIGEPVHDVNRNVVDVNYTVIIVDAKSEQAQEIKETHSMRYLFLPEIALLAEETGFEVVEAGEWLTARELSARSWSAYVALRPINHKA
jgi:SAM-dependent methyltransferase